MKRLLAVFLISFTLLTFCSCSRNNAENSGDNLQDVSDENMQGDLTDGVSDLPEEDIEIKPQTFTKDFDGVVLTVTTDKSTYSVGEPINVTATLENNTDKAINLFYGASTTNGSAELMPYFEQLIEFPIYGNIWRDDVVTIISFAQGEKCVQDFTFQTYTDYFQGTSENGYITIPTDILPDYDKPAKPGVHSGKLCVHTCSDVNDTWENITDYTLDFSVTLI